MKVLGITGGVGAGKSMILGYLEGFYQARVILADEVGRMLQQPGEICYQQIVKEFGQEILLEDGNLNREKIARLIFSDEEKRRAINNIVHPEVKAAIKKQIEQEKMNAAVPFVVIESAILPNTELEELCDTIWYIYAEEETRIQRLKTSRGYSEAKARQIMENQMSDSGYRERCDKIIDNNSDFVPEAFAQIDEGLRENGFL